MHRSRLHAVCAFVAVVVTGVVSAASVQMPTSFAAAWALADAAHARFDVRTEYRLLEHAEGLTASALDRAPLQRRLAVLEWKYFGRGDAARERLRAATRGADPARAWLELARLELALDQPGAARLAADQALLGAGTAELLERAALASWRGLLEVGLAQRRAGEELQVDALAGAARGLAEMVAAEPGRLEPSRLLLGVALLIDDGAATLAGWRSYYHAFPGSPLPNAIAEAGDALPPLLERLTPGQFDLEHRRALVHALTGTRFVQEAAVVALDPRLRAALADDPEIGALLAYDAALRRLSREVETYYRRTILDDYEPEALTLAARAAGAAVWQAVHGEPPAEQLANEALWALLEERFGAVLRLARTNRRYDLVMGHVVTDEERTVEQYGRQARVRFVELDNMVSRGFRDWAWEHRQGARGFASSSTITQVRPAYVPEALWAWRVVIDPRIQAVHERRMAAEAAADERRAAADPHAYLPGLGMRLAQQGRLQLLASLRAEGLEQEALRAAFVWRYQEAVRQSSIFAHEGRHVMDLRERVRYHREYAARLSEVAFAEHPRLAFSGIIDSNIGDESFHGSANLLLMQGLVGWMEEHREEISGLDPRRPLLPQLDLLTDEQLRQACRDLDPYPSASAP